MGNPVRPIKFNQKSGDMEQVTPMDDLPNQQDIQDNRDLVRLLILRLVEAGNVFLLNDPILLSEVQQLQNV